MNRLEVTVTNHTANTSVTYHVYVPPERESDITKRVLAPVKVLPLVTDGLEAALRRRYVIMSHNDDERCDEWVASFTLSAEPSMCEPIVLTWTNDKSQAFKFDNYDVVMMVHHVAACHATIQDIRI